MKDIKSKDDPKNSSEKSGHSHKSKHDMTNWHQILRSCWLAIAFLRNLMAGYMAVSFDG